MASPLRHISINAGDVERAKGFYERVFGWTFRNWGPPDFYLIQTGPAVERGLWQGLLAKRQGAAAAGAINAFRCTVSVSSIKETVAAIAAAGGKLRSAIIDIPGVGKVAEFADTEDNIACAMQYELREFR